MQQNYKSLELDTKPPTGRNGVSHELNYNENLINNQGLIHPKISVIIPVLSEEKLLEATLLSYPVELRKRFNIELIVSDGGSTDKTIEIAEMYADIVVRHTEPHKQTIAEGRNKGAEAATGDILVFINGDTIPKTPEQFFANICDWFNGNDKNKSCSALACPVYVAPEEIIFKDKLFYTFHNFYVKLLNLIGLGMGRGECQIVRSEIFKKVGGYNPLIAAGEDFDLYHRINKIGHIGFADNLLVYESPRRFRKFGYFRVLASWSVNSIAVLFYGKSVSDEWEAVR